MTEAVSADAGNEESAPEGHYWAEIKGRRLLVKEVSTGQQLVLGGMIRDARNGDLEYNLDTLGKMMKMMRSLIAPEDQAWLEEGILVDEIKIQDFGFVFAPRGHAAPEKPKTPPRARRGR